MARVNKIVWYWQKDKPTDPWHRMESLEVNPHIYGQLIFDEGAKTIFRKIISSTNVAETTEHLQNEQKNLTVYFISCTQTKHRS